MSYSLSGGLLSSGVLIEIAPLIKRGPQMASYRVIQTRLAGHLEQLIKSKKN